MLSAAKDGNARRGRFAMLKMAGHAHYSQICWSAVFLGLAAFMVASGSAAPGNPSGAASSSYPQLIYTKVLKGSVPAYEEVVVNSDGTGSYDGRALNEAPHPRPFKLSLDVTQELFRLAGDLNDFHNVQLESRKRVADLGLKTFTYRDGGQRYSTQFNYSTNRTASRLVDLFEKVSAVELHISALDYAMKYDHLGLPRQLTLIEIDLNNHSLADPQLMTGALEAIIHNPRYLVLAQDRAKRILDRIEKNEKN